MTKGPIAGTNPFSPEESFKKEVCTKNPFTPVASLASRQELEDPSEHHGYITWRIVEDLTTSVGAQSELDIAHSAPDNKSSEPHSPIDKEIITLTFLPGGIGMELEDGGNSGRIWKIHEGQAKAAGVRAWWVMRRVNNEPYSIARLQEKIVGTEPYNITFESPRETTGKAENPFASEEFGETEPGSTNPFTPDELVKMELSAKNPFTASSKNPFTLSENSFTAQEESAAIILQSVHRGNMARRSMKRDTGVVQLWRDVVPNLRPGAEVVLKCDEQSMLQWTEELKLRKHSLGVIKDVAHNGNRLVAWPYCQFEDVWVDKDLLEELEAMPIAKPSVYACAWKCSSSSTLNPIRWSKAMDMETATCDVETFASKNVATPPQHPITLTITCREDGAVVRHLRFDQPKGAVAFLQKEHQRQRTAL